MIRRILKYIGVILTVLVGLFCTIIIIDGFFIHYHFWIYPPRYDLSSYISICRNSIRLENAIFRHNPYVEYNDDSFRNWLVKVNDKWYDVYGYDSLDSTLVVNEQTDSLVTYKFKSKYYRNKFQICFHETEVVDMSSDDKIPWDDITWHSGIYKFSYLSISSKMRNVIHSCYPPVTKFELKLINIRHNIRFMYDDIKRFFEQTFTKSSSDLLDQYITSDLIHIRHPLIYIPFPLDKGYIFGGDVLKNFNLMTEYVHDQNFYAILAEIPSDIKRLGKVIACDENGVLLSLDRSKTPIMRVRLKRLKEDELFYASFFKYKKKHLRKMISEEEYQIIDAYDKTAINSYEMYDKRIFVNMRKMLSELDYEEVSNQCGWE